jgi:hypothetical protein
MSPVARSSQPVEGGLTDEPPASLIVDGARHSLVWIHDEERSVSLLVDRPEGGAKELLLGSLNEEESREQLEALVAHYEEHYVGRPRGERPQPRALEPDDLKSGTAR